MSYGNHRKIAEKKIGRKLRSNEVVHHKDHIPINNDPKNLEVMTHKEHQILHFKGRDALYKYRKQRGGESNES